MQRGWDGGTSVGVAGTGGIMAAVVLVWLVLVSGGGYCDGAAGTGGGRGAMVLVCLFWDELYTGKYVTRDVHWLK